MEGPLARAFRAAEWLQPGLALEKAEPACPVKRSLGGGRRLFLEERGEGAMESLPEDPRLSVKVTP